MIIIPGVTRCLMDLSVASVAATGGKPAEHGTMVGSMQQFYGKVRAAFGDTNYGYVAELEAQARSGWRPVPSRCAG